MGGRQLQGERAVSYTHLHFVGGDVVGAVEHLLCGSIVEIDIPSRARKVFKGYSGALQFIVGCLLYTSVAVRPVRVDVQHRAEEDVYIARLRVPVSYTHLPSNLPIPPTDGSSVSRKRLTSDDCFFSFSPSQERVKKLSLIHI